MCARGREIGRTGGRGRVREVERESVSERGIGRTGGRGREREVDRECVRGREIGRTGGRGGERGRCLRVKILVGEGEGHARERREQRLLVRPVHLRFPRQRVERGSSIALLLPASHSSRCILVPHFQLYLNIRRRIRRPAAFPKSEGWKGQLDSPACCSTQIDVC